MMDTKAFLDEISGRDGECVAKVPTQAFSFLFYVIVC